MTTTAKANRPRRSRVDTRVRLATILVSGVAGALLVPGSLMAAGEGGAQDAQPPVAVTTPSEQPATPAPADTPAAADPGAQADPAPPRMQQPQSPPAPVREAAAKSAPADGSKAGSRKKDAHAAASGAVTIKNFAFGPATIRINAGDTVTWTNRDSAQHTASGKGGSFNTGILNEGKSASHTFSKAGTFAYICAIHPDMHGTVVVAAASGGSTGTSSGSGSSTGSSGSSGSATPSTSATAAASGSGGATLPNTGLELVATIIVGAMMALCGGAIRRLLA